MARKKKQPLSQARDYTEDRKGWYKKVTLDELREAAKEFTNADALAVYERARKRKRKAS